jgi:transketolase
MPNRRQLANAIRALSMDAVQKANSGHPGMPMGMADIAQVLWSDFLKYNPSNPQWPDRDRFVLSNGHGSMLLYSLLYLTGYPMTIDEIKRFRQLGSHTAGHPEYEPHLGIETTTGPAGPGSREWRRDGDRREDARGHVQPARSRGRRSPHVRIPRRRVPHGRHLARGVLIAGTLKLGKLICFYDDNGISIDGEVRGWFTDNTPRRFEAYGWHVVPNVDGHDAAAVTKAIEAARAGDRSTVDDLLQDDHRLGRSEQAGHRGDARQRAR